MNDFESGSDNDLAPSSVKNIIRNLLISLSIFVERKTRMPSRKDPPVRPPPITNVNNTSNNKLLTEEAVTLRNPANISKLCEIYF